MFNYSSNTLLVLYLRRDYFKTQNDKKKDWKSGDFSS